MTAVEPLARLNSVTRRCTSMTGYRVDTEPDSFSDVVPVSTHPA